MSFQGETKESICSGFGCLYFDTFHFSHLYIVLNFSTFICHSEQSEESIFSVGWFIFCYVSFFPPLHCTKLSSCAHLCGGHFLLSVVTKGSKSTLSLIGPQGDNYRRSSFVYLFVRSLSAHRGSFFCKLYYR